MNVKEVKFEFRNSRLYMANVQTHGETKVFTHVSRSISKYIHQVVILFRKMCKYLAFEEFPLFTYSDEK